MANTPEPIQRKDRYYDYLINGGDLSLLPEPIQREEMYLYYLCQNGFGGGTVTPEQIDAAVERYMQEHPIELDVLDTVEDVENNTDPGKLVDALAVKEVFQSVSDGKEKIASAITDKGVETDATATFDTMAQNIGNIQGGGDYLFYEGDYNLIPKVMAQTMDTKEKVMKENVTVAEIPFHEVSNETGKTIIIGGIL